MRFSFEVGLVSCFRSTSGHRQQTRDVLFLSSFSHFPDTRNEGSTHFDGDISSGCIFLDFKVKGPPPPPPLPPPAAPSSKSLGFLFFAFSISQDLKSHTCVISVYSATKQSDEVKECTLLLQSSLKRFGKQLPARPLTLPLHAGVRLRRSHSWIRLPVLPLTCTAALSLTHWQSALYVWKWAVITTICVPSLVFYNGAFPMGCLLPPVLPSFSSSRCFHPLSPAPLVNPSPVCPELLRSPSPSFTLPLMQMTGTGAVLIMPGIISPLFRFSSSLSAFCTTCFGIKPTPIMYLRIGKLEIWALPPRGIHKLTGAFHLYLRGASHSWLSHYQQTARRLVVVTVAPSSDNPYRNFSNIVSLQARLKVHLISR